MGELVPFETFKQRKERQDAAKEMAKRRASIRRLLGYAEKHDWEKDDDES